MVNNDSNHSQKLEHSTCTSLQLPRQQNRVNCIISFCTASYACSWKPQNTLLEVICKELLWRVWINHNKKCPTMKTWSNPGRKRVKKSHNMERMLDETRGELQEDKENYETYWHSALQIYLLHTAQFERCYTRPISNQAISTMCLLMWIH